MKMNIFSVAILAASLSSLFAGDPSISIVEKSSRGESKSIATIRADDDVARDEIIALWREAKKAFPENRRDLFGPDSGFVAIELTDGKETMVIRSWHPLFVKNRKLVVTSHGVESLNGRKPEDVLKEDEAWYREARTIFDKIVSYTKNKGERKAETVPGKETARDFIESSRRIQRAPTELEIAVAELKRARKLVDTNVISRLELLQAEEKEALLRAKEEGSPTPAIASASVKVRFARKRLKMKQAHFDAGIISQAELDAVQGELKSAEAELGKALNHVEPTKSE